MTRFGLSGTGQKDPGYCRLSAEDNFKRSGKKKWIKYVSMEHVHCMVA
jgi:hypothetical protein